MMVSLSTRIKKWVARKFDLNLARIVIDEGWGTEDDRFRWVFYEVLPEDEWPLTKARVKVRITVKKRTVVLSRKGTVYYDGIRLGTWKRYNPDELPRLEINVEARPRGLVR